MIIAGLQAADNVIFTREAIESVSRRHGLIASFLPKPNPSWAGSGAHTHFSIQDEDGKNLMGELLLNLKGEGSVAESFVAGKPLVASSREVYPLWELGLLSKASSNRIS